jgi:hypothetical protein
MTAFVVTCDDAMPYYVLNRTMFRFSIHSGVSERSRPVSSPGAVRVAKRDEMRGEFYSVVRSSFVSPHQI